ncbi:zinc ribbon domain-containing protein [Paenibacillus tritici]|uniref:Zinc ribbon domain-containing protein n=1 Tax=Paenibacillus tritici TaxID=1873425 RepID=A0ABX2DX86_9BACL|nr:zinc ribbon domain-containing protein [Paenibacillus tritici]NQX48737.1 zinc ribbon domain-containing protein [Paenibacillus tritici]QUL55490.1 zinc ribbon domain-containing protein [Paenibacillus tritici]
MNFLQRIKDGASRVSEKAQSSVEVSKLNGQISDIEHEMQIEFLKMGKLFYEGYRSRDMSVAEGQMIELARGCNKLQEKIEGVRSRIAELRNERLCTCGKIVALDANFCPHCGRKLEEISLRKEPVVAAAATAPAAPTVTVHTVHEHEDEEDQYYGEEELTEAERELARRPEARVQYAEVLPEIEDEEEPEDYDGGIAGSDRSRREADELERERERQLELDRRIRDWKASEPAEETVAVETDTREIVKCQICRADLPKGSMWCPRCGSEQI